jgi:hypothetical protein
VKKLAILVGILAVLGLGTGAGASLVTITFDESFLSAGGSNRYDGTQILDQFSGAPWGITWADTYTGTGNYTGQTIAGPSEFTFSSPAPSNNYLFVYGNNTGSGGGTQTATATLATPSSYFSIDYRRPQASGTFTFVLYSGATAVYNSTAANNGTPLTWDPTLDSGFKNLAVSGVTFDKIVITESDKSEFDNLKINPVPIPGALFLFAPGLAALVAVRRRKQK